MNRPQAVDAALLWVESLMTANKRLNLWMASDETERDALGSDHGVAAGDFCLVDAANLYVAQSVSAGSSAWVSMAGSAEDGGPVAVGGRNLHPTLNRWLFTYVGVMYRSVLDDTPSTISLSSYASYQWPTANLNVNPLSTLGFFVFGTSSSIAPDSTAWWRGTYSLSF